MSRGPYDVPDGPPAGWPDHLCTLWRYPEQDGVDEYFDELEERGWLVPKLRTVFDGISGDSGSLWECASAVDTWTPGPSASPPEHPEAPASLSSDDFGPGSSLVGPV